jgi:hypothetical protein
MSAEREIFEAALLTQRVASRFVVAQEDEEAFEKAFYYLGDQLKAGLDPKYGYDKLVEIEKGYNPFSWGLSAQVENVTGHTWLQLGISGEQIYLKVNRKKFAQAAIRPDKPLLPQFKKFVDRGVTMYFKKMFYHDFLRVLDEHEESQRLVEKQQQEVKKQRVESEEAEAKEAQARVTGIKERPDLKPVPRGGSTNPNSYGVPTFYEVLGENLSASSQAKVTDWLKQNRKNLTPGRHHGSYGQSDEVSLGWDPRQGAWIIVSRYWYTGD